MIINIAKNRACFNENSTKLGIVLFPLFNAISFISFFLFNIRAGIVAGIIISFYVITHAKCLSCFDDLTFKFFFLINIASVHAYLFNERPFVLFLTSITYNLLPMLMYGVGRASNSGERDNPIFKVLLYSNLIVVLVGFLIYFTPSLAIRVGMESMQTAGFNESWKGYRFGSYMGASLELGSICAISIPLLLMSDFKYKAIKPFMLVVFAVALLLTMQRGAWIVGIVGLLASVGISAILEKKGFKEIFVYALFGVLLVYSIFFFVDHYMSDEFLKHFQMRLEKFDVNTMSNERSYQAEAALALLLDYPLGFGLGAAGIKAAAYNLAIVPDNNLLRILLETGIYGMVAFAILNVKAFLQGLKHRYYYMVVVVLLFLAHSLGSSVLDFYYSSFVYWYILGFLNRPDEQYAFERDKTAYYLQKK